MAGVKIIVPKDLGPKPIPPGVYKVRFTGHKVKQTGPDSKVPGTTMLSMEYQILTQGPDDSVKTIGRKLWDNCTLAPEALWKLDQVTKAFAGLPLPEGEYTEEELIARLIAILTNKEALAIVTNETYQGRTQDRVKEFKPAA